MDPVRSSADADAIRRLTEAYALGMDAADPEAFFDLFVPDGALIVRSACREEPLGVFSGPEGVGRIASLLGELYRATMHHITSHIAEVDGDRADGTTMCLAYHLASGEEGEVLETLGVRYEETLVQTGDGWRFQARDATRVWSQITPVSADPLLVDRAAARRRSARESR
jgi:hypothetical protein